MIFFAAGWLSSCSAMTIRSSVLDEPDLPLPATVHRVAVVSTSGEDARAVARGVSDTLVFSPGLSTVSEDAVPDLVVIVESVDLVVSTTEDDEESVDGMTVARLATGSAVFRSMLSGGEEHDGFEAEGRWVWPVVASSASQAERELPSSDAARAALARALGAAYARRIAPVWFSERRVVYVSGHPALRGTRRALSGGDWGAAEGAWQALLASEASPALRGRAAHSLSVAAEARGALHRAQAFAQRALALWPVSRTETQLSRLRARLAEVSAT